MNSTIIKNYVTILVVLSFIFLMAGALIHAALIGQWVLELSGSLVISWISGVVYAIGTSVCLGMASGLYFWGRGREKELKRKLEESPGVSTMTSPLVIGGLDDEDE